VSAAPDGQQLDELKVAKDIAFEWFKIHADQRLRVFNFFLIIAGFCVAGFFTSFQSGNKAAAAVIAAVLVCVCYCFKQLDRRTAQLVKVGEELLETCFDRVSSRENWPEMNLILKARQTQGVHSYRQIFNWLFWLFGLLGAAGVIRALAP
jgi:hypothetical protein